MKKFVLYSFLIMFSSCVITETPDSYVEYKIINKSNHKIKLDINYNNNVTHYCILNPDQEFVEPKKLCSDRFLQYFPFFVLNPLVRKWKEASKLSKLTIFWQFCIIV